MPNRRLDTGHAEGFTASQMIVRAFQLGPQKADDMIPALEGLEFGGIKIGMSIRPGDHLLLNPLWGGHLTWTGASGAITAVTDRAFLPPETTPPL